MSASSNIGLPLSFHKTGSTRLRLFSPGVDVAPSTALGAWMRPASRLVADQGKLYDGPPRRPLGQAGVKEAVPTKPLAGTKLSSAGGGEENAPAASMNHRSFRHHAFRAGGERRVGESCRLRRRRAGPHLSRPEARPRRLAMASSPVVPSPSPISQGGEKQARDRRPLERIGPASVSGRALRPRPFTRPRPVNRICRALALPKIRDRDRHLPLWQTGFWVFLRPADSRH